MTRPSTPPRRGVALVLVLWLVVVLGGIGVAVITETRASTGLVANLRAAAAARFAAESGIEATVAAIEERLALVRDSSARRALLNGLERESATADSITLGIEGVAVAIVDASARLDVNLAPEANLATLFSRFTDVARAAGTARAIRHRIERGDNGADADAESQRTGDTTVRRVYPLRSLEALRGIPGVDTRAVQLAAPYLTVDGDGTINRQSASDPVMAAAFGELRDEPSRLVLIARGWIHGHPMTHEIQGVYAISNDRLVLVHWRERVL